MSRQSLMRAGVAVALAVTALALPGAALAVPPANDAFATAVAIDPAATSFTEPVMSSEATEEVGEPQYCAYSPRTVWYSITPSSTELVRVSMAGSSFFDTNLRAYRQDGSGLGGLSFINCATYGGSLQFELQAGETYYFQASDVWTGGGTLVFDFVVIPPPANDNFADAMSISVPFSGTVDTTAATDEPNEPTPSCGYGLPAGSAWYAFTAPTGGSYSASTEYVNFTSQVGVYKGNSLASLSQLGCRTSGSLLTFHLDAGETVYLQVGGVWTGYRGTVRLNFTVAPDPFVQMNVSPWDPNIFDNVQLCDYSYDPGNVGIQSRSWSFGDGTGSTEQCPLHRYAADDTYTVELTVTTFDGRTKSLSRELIVKTHDVSIAKVGVPQTGNVGQTRQISVGVTNNRYAENIRVVLEKSIAGGGWQQVGMLTQYVPVRGPNRTTNFAFSYTFAPEDAVLGKITFRAVAELVSARDAIPTDNTFISLATKVNG